MKTKEEIRKYAQGLASEHFYADVEDLTPWEPFEYYPEEWIAEEVESLAFAVEEAMLWAQGVK
jgi:hypothetical protein